MVRIAALAVALTLGTLTTAAVAQAQTLTAEERAACQADYDKYCKGTMPGGGRIIACLNKQNDKLSAACQKVVADASKKK